MQFSFSEITHIPRVRGASLCICVSHANAASRFSDNPAKTDLPELNLSLLSFSLSIVSETSL